MRDQRTIEAMGWKAVMGILFTVLLFGTTMVSATSQTPAPEGSRPAAASAPPDSAIAIDIPIGIESAQIVLNVSHMGFEGDQPVSLSFLHEMVTHFAANDIPAQIVAVYHGEAGYMMLADETYDRVRRWQGGNPYKDQIATLMAAGVTFEECSKTMADNHWTNADLLDGVEVNAGANFRVVELVQKGYVQIAP